MAGGSLEEKLEKREIRKSLKMLATMLKLLAADSGIAAVRKWIK